MDLLLQLFGRLGIVIVFFHTLLHEIGLPIPLTPTVVLAGAALSEFTGLSLLIIAVVAGTLIGNAIWFAAGRRFGAGMLRELSKFSLLPATCVGKTARAFDRWGEAAFIIGRFIPGVSLVAPPLAGAMGMSWGRFLWLSAIGATLWATVIALVGVALKYANTGLAPVFEHVGSSPSVVGALIVTGYLAWRWLRPQHAERLRSVPRVTAGELRRLLKGTSASSQSAEIGRIPGALATDLGAGSPSRDPEIVAREATPT